MLPLTLKAAARLGPSRRGDFGAEIFGGNLLLPEEVAQTFFRLGARDAMDMLSFLDAFPTAVASDLDWGPDDVRSATDRLRDQLRGHLKDAFLAPSGSATPRVYGAIKP